MKEALKLALEALENLISYDYHGQPDNGIDIAGVEALTAIKEALAQPAQEPVAWMSDQDVGFKKSEFGVTATVPLYTTPPKRPWVGLTEDQFLEAARLAEAGNYLVAFQLIQQCLKEANT